MRIVNGLNQFGRGMSASAVTIGNFDGLHLGHRKLVGQLVETAKKYSVPSVVITFSPHPSHILRPTEPTPQMFDVKDLEIELQRMGVDILIVEPFTYEFSQLTAEQFIADSIYKILRPKEIIVGYDFSFGKARSGTFTLLQQMAEQYQFRVKQIAPELFDGEIVSSSLIRKLITHGQIERATAMLGREFYISGHVVHGDGRGHKLGFATANIETAAQVLPDLGVYLTWFKCGSQQLASITNLGVRPTFYENKKLTIETHLLQGAADLYGQKVQLAFIKPVRAELKFSSAHELIKQIEQDVLVAKKFFGII